VQDYHKTTVANIRDVMLKLIKYRVGHREGRHPCCDAATIPKLTTITRRLFRLRRCSQVRSPRNNL